MIAHKWTTTLEMLTENLPLAKVSQELVGALSIGRVTKELLLEHNAGQIIVKAVTGQQWNGKHLENAYDLFHFTL